LIQHTIQMEILTKLSPIFRLFFLLALPVFGYAQQFPVNNQKIVQGVGTTAQGVSSYSSSPPTVNPAATTWRHVTSLHMDTVRQVQYIYKRPRWYPISVVRDTVAPPATKTSGAATIDYTESIWQNTVDSLTYYYEEENACWQPIGTYLSSTTPVDVAATGSTGAICYGYGLWYDPDVDSIYAQQGATWTAIGAGSAGAVDSIVVLQDSIIVGYSEGVEVTRDTIGYPAGATVTASNGLTKTVNDIKLGGTLTGNTFVSGASTYDLDLTAMDSLSISFSKRLLITQNSQRFLHQTGGGGGGGVFENLFLGYQAGFSAQGTGTGYANTIIGHRAGYALTLISAGGLTTATSNVFLGYTAGLGCTNCTGNTFLGTASGSAAVSTYANTYVGWHAGINATGSYNTFLGRDAGSTATSSETVAVGVLAGSKSNGIRNTFLGAYAGQDIASASQENVFIGWKAGGNSGNVSAGYNIFIGAEAGFNNTTGNTNTFVGRNAGKANTTGNVNTYIGNNAATNMTTGSNNILIQAGAAAFPSATQSNSILIGPNIYATGTYTGSAMRMGIGNGTFRDPRATLHVRAYNKSINDTTFCVSNSTAEASVYHNLFITSDGRTVVQNETATNVALEVPSGDTDFYNDSRIRGTLEVNTLSGTATQLGAFTSGNVATTATLGAGLSFSSGTLNGAFLPLTLTGATEVNTAGQTLRIRDAGSYPDVFMNNTYWLAASSALTYISVGSDLDTISIVTDRGIILNTNGNIDAIGDTLKIDANLGDGHVRMTGNLGVGDITNGDGITLAAYAAGNILTSVTIDGTGNSGLLFDDGALTLSNNLSEVADTVTRTLGTGQQIYANGYATYSGSGFTYSSGRITNGSGASRICKIRYYFTAETAGVLTDALTVRVMIWDGATYMEHRAGRLTMTLNDDWELTGSKETIITLPDGDGVNIAFDSTDGLDVSNFGYVIEKI